jgi:ArsR family transcriptional regulator, arsenate/arsenite/antimonite-responsive transcriptional repressor
VNLLFKGLDDPTRRKIIEMLKKRDMTAGEIADHFKISKPSISHHLDLLKRAKLIAGVRDGQFISYSLNTAVFDELIKWIAEVTKKNKT